MSDRRDLERKRNAGTLLALLALMLVSVGLVLLVAMVMPQAAGLLAVVLGMGVFIAFHYVTWGWWMSRRQPPEREESDEV